jgi:hypothetical protein
MAWGNSVMYLHIRVNRLEGQRWTKTTSRQEKKIVFAEENIEEV